MQNVKVRNGIRCCSLTFRVLYFAVFKFSMQYPPHQFLQQFPFFLAGAVIVHAL